ESLLPTGRDTGHACSWAPVLLSLAIARPVGAKSITPLLRFYEHIVSTDFSGVLRIGLTWLSRMAILYSVLAPILLYDRCVSALYQRPLIMRAILITGDRPPTLVS